jgi:splicing factor 1
MLITGVLSMKSERFRSPSPVPIYDPETGLRQNTLEQMMRRDLELERRECMGEAAKINAEIKIPTNFRPAMKEVKLFIPQNEHPGYNFIGLILGPRGSTQKRLEAETGAKVTIRGKGAAKEGGQIRLDAYGRLPPGWNEETHVHIAAETWDKLDAAIELVEPLLTYVNEEKNIHKTAQMLQLAKMNGTVRLEAFEEDITGKLMLIQMVNGPKEPDQTGLYQLPLHMLKEVNDQYRRDIALVKGIRVENSEDQFQQFMQELRGSTKLQN